MMPTQFLRHSAPLAIATFLLVAQLSAAAADPARPNIVVFLVDDMGIMDTSVPFLTNDAGSPQRYPLNDFYRTPSMQRLASQGIRFNQFYAMSVCSPTRVSIMTGQNAARHHTTNWINPNQDNRGPLGPPQWNWRGLDEDDVTLPRLLAIAGYHTIHVGKGHFGPEDTPGAEPLNLGFDINVAGASFGAPGSYYGEDNYGHAIRSPGKKNQTVQRSRHAVPHLDDYHQTDTFLTEALTLEANKRLSETVESDAPFFLYFAHYAVHAPFHSDPRFAEHYEASEKPKTAQAFATLIEGMDKSLGDLLDHLDKLGVAENTLILFLGDNGTDAPLGHQHEVACAAPLRGRKGAHYEGGMRVPMIAAWAKPNPDHPAQQSLAIPANAIQPQVASVQDLCPTLLEIAHAKAPESHTIDGSSLTKLLTGNHDPDRSETFLMHYPHAPHRSDYFTVYRNGDWKAIYHYHPSNVSNQSHYQLFNLKQDPFEQTDLAATQPQKLHQLITEMSASLEHHHAQYPLTSPTDPTPQPIIIPPL